jgi:6,7-dimethyl-8-ribityllumazine synthase
MVTVYEGSFDPPTGRVALVASRFNTIVVESLITGAIDALRRYGVAEANIDRIHVPGSFEIPLVAQQLGRSGRYAAIICLGCILRGDTDHYEHVAGAAASGIAQAGLQSGIPIIFGVLTCDTLEQALQRAGGKAGNKGFEAAVTAIEMANLMAVLPR